MITREQAIEIADEVRREHMLGRSVTRVNTWEELGTGTPTLYFTGNMTQNSLWIAYIEPLQLFGLQSSTIVAIDRETGEVMYHGSANDEG